jgi:hypothetical protein
MGKVFNKSTDYRLVSVRLQTAFALAAWAAHLFPLRSSPDF